MTITISIFLAVLILFILNIILEHLFNWWVRKANEEDGQLSFAVFIWVVKTALLFGLLFYILKN